MHRFGASGVLHILDDFFFNAKTRTKCRSDLSNFLHLCGYLGVLIAQEKTVGPSQVIQFVGIILYSVRQEARLPEDKLQKCRLLLQSFYKRWKVTLRELHSLLGLLNFTCSVAVRGRPFLRRMINLTVGVRHAHHRIRLSKGTKHYKQSGSISFYITFLELFLIVLAARLRSCHMSNRCIMFVTDNAALVSVINQQTS